MKRIALLLGLAIFFVLTGSTSSLAAVPRVEIILDVSGSMTSVIEGRQKIDIAKEAVEGAVESIGASAEVSLRVYGKNFSNDPKDKDKSCKDSELLVPFALNNSVRVRAAMKSLVPRGYTPLAYSLKRAGEDFASAPKDSQIILLTDGEETCGGDPVAEATALAAKGIPIKVNVIGFQVSEVERAKLDAIAKAGGGKYYDAKDAPSLGAGFKSIVDTEIVPDRARLQTVGTERLSGGDSFQNAVLFPQDSLGNEFSLTNHLRADTYEMFTVPVKTGQTIMITARTGAVGVRAKSDNTLAETDIEAYIRAGVTIFSSGRAKLAQVKAMGSFAEDKQSVLVSENGNIFIAIGTASDAVHRDSRFSVDIDSVNIDSPVEAKRPVVPVESSQNKVSPQQSQPQSQFSALTVTSLGFNALFLIVIIIMFIKWPKKSDLQ